MSNDTQPSQSMGSAWALAAPLLLIPPVLAVIGLAFGAGAKAAREPRLSFNDFGRWQRDRQIWEMLDVLSAASLLVLGVCVLGVVFWAKFAARHVRNTRRLSAYVIAGVVVVVLVFWLAYDEGARVGATLMSP